MRVRNNGVEIAVYEQGNPDGETIVAFHGWPDSHHLWDGVLPHLTERFRVVTVDNRGHGASTDTTDMTVDNMADDYAAVIDAVSPDKPVHILAHDWGSAACWELVCRPGMAARISSFTSVSAPGADHVGSWLRANLGRGNLINPLVQAASFAYMVPFAAAGRLLFRPMNEKLWRRIVSTAEMVPAEQVHLGPTLAHDIANGTHIYRTTVAGTAIRSPQRRVTEVPVQIIVGTRDPAIRQRVFSEHTEWTDRAWMRVLDGGHWLPFSHPAALAGAVNELVDAVSGGVPARALRRAQLGYTPGEFEDKLVVVTGAGSGIGRETALAFARLGAEIVLSDIDIAGAKDTQQRIEDEGGLAHAYQLDVSDPAAVAQHAEEVFAAHGIADIVINNAGIGQAGRFLETTATDFDRVLDVNLGGVVSGCRAFLPKMVERNTGGHVVNVSSMAAYAPQQGMSAYATSKAAVFMFSDCLRAELSGTGIRVSTICPGIVHTNIVATTKFSGVSADEEADRQRKFDKLYERRGYGPEKVAAQIVQAVRKGKDVVPVTPEAHVQYHFSRLAPALNRFEAAHVNLLR